MVITNTSCAVLTQSVFVYLFNFLGARENLCSD